MTKKYNVEYVSWPKDHLKSLIYSFFRLDSQVNNNTILLLTFWFVFIIAFIFLISVCCLIARYFFRRSSSYQTAISSNNWPSVVGEIVSSFLGGYSTRDYTANEPIITYSYNLGGNDYQAKRVVIGQWSHSLNQKWSEQKVQKYRPGKSVTIYYNPNSPEMAVLEPGMNSQIRMKWYGISVCGSCFVVPLVFFISLVLTMFLMSLF